LLAYFTWNFGYTNLLSSERLSRILLVNNTIANIKHLFVHFFYYMLINLQSVGYYVYVLDVGEYEHILG
jgi:hypothetical protein